MMCSFVLTELSLLTFNQFPFTIIYFTLQAQLMMKMDALNNIFDKKKDEWQMKINQLECALEKTKDSLHEEKARRRHQFYRRKD
jgi:hypothetical protein